MQMSCLDDWFVSITIFWPICVMHLEINKMGYLLVLFYQELT